MNSFNIDLDLIKKYNVAGPRYTSYPTAPHFSEDVSREDVLDLVRQSNHSARELSLYFHIPFCQTLCWYCGCTTVIGRNQNRTQAYLEALEREMAIKSRALSPDREVVQLHFGGGTPTYLSPEEIVQLGESIQKYFTYSPAIEAAVEIDPRRIRKAHIEALKTAGFNRASIGVQDNHPRVQKAVNRIQPMELTQKAVDWLREVGIDSINIDLIYGLPYQTVETFEQTIDEVLTLEPDRFAIYSYAHVPWIKPSQKLLERHALPSADTKLAIHKMTIEKLTTNGYLYIGMDHYAREGNELAVAQGEGKLQRNFQGYSTCAGADIVGFGMSAISQFDTVYIQNPKELEDYYSSIERGEYPVFKGYVLSDDDRIRRDTIMRLMCDGMLDFEKMSALLEIDFKSYFKQELASLGDLVADNLLSLTDRELRLTEMGQLLMRNVAMRFDRYLTAQEEGFSRTI